MNDNCVICLNNISNNDLGVAKLPCNHVFHLNCFLDWNKKICPLCRNEQLNFVSKNIIEATKMGNLNAIKCLINLGYDLNIQDVNNDTALIWASYNNYNNIVKLLLDAGADPNKQNRHKETALSYAVLNGNIDILSLLLISNADKSLKNEADLTVIDCANIKQTEILTQIKKLEDNITDLTHKYNIYNVVKDLLSDNNL